jgi:RNA polymerase sigma factor (sigma-70 family)
VAEADTEIGGSGEAFPETIGSLLGAARDPQALQHKAALNRFFLLYWRPVYACVRRRGVRVEDAKDLTQEFMVELLEHGMLSRYEPARGTFRAYLKGALRLFLAEHARAEGRRRDASTWAIHPDNVAHFESAQFVADLGRFSAEEMFDRHLAQETVARCLRTLRRELESAGRRVHFDVYTAYDLTPASPAATTYRSVGEAFGLSEHAVTKALEYVRRRLDELLVQATSECASSPDEARESLQEARDCWSDRGWFDPRSLDR